MKKPKLTYYVRWYIGQGPKRYRTRKPIRLNDTLYGKDVFGVKTYFGVISGMGWEEDKYVLDLR